MDNTEGRQATGHLCPAVGTTIQLTWRVEAGRAVDRHCSVEGGCSRYLRPAQSPQTAGAEPISACALLLSDQG